MTGLFKSKITKNWDAK